VVLDVEELMEPMLLEVVDEEALEVLEEPLVFVVLTKLEVLEVKEELNELAKDVLDGTLDVVLLDTPDACDEDVEDDDELVIPVVELD
jgi:hypothetical protein